MKHFEFLLRHYSGYRSIFYFIINDISSLNYDFRKDLIKYIGDFYFNNSTELLKKLINILDLLNKKIYNKKDIQFSKIIMFKEDF
jgi:hypothetical protein